MWDAPPEPLALSDGCVDVWRLSLDPPPQAVEHAARLLTDLESARAARFRFARDRRCYALTRATLRQLLGDYLDASPRDLELVTGEHGKPALTSSQQSDPPIEFNVSHSGDYALLAFARARSVGVDIEHVRPRKSLDLVAEHHFSPEERDMLPEVGDHELLRCFYRCWTRKEAYMKATGQGVALGLKSFAVTVDDPARLLWTDRGDANRWQLLDITVDEDHAAALCVAGTAPLQIRHLHAQPTE